MIVFSAIQTVTLLQLTLCGWLLPTLASPTRPFDVPVPEGSPARALRGAVRRRYRALVVSAGIAIVAATVGTTRHATVLAIGTATTAAIALLFLSGWLAHCHARVTLLRATADLPRTPSAAAPAGDPAGERPGADRFPARWMFAVVGTQAFASAAVGLAAGVALIRGLVRHHTDRIGNFWVDLTRGITRILLPLAVVSAIVLIGLGVAQNLAGAHDVTTLAGARQTILGGPVGSWEPIKLMSGDGGGIFNANSAHPFENPNALSNAFEIILMLLIPTAFIRTFGRMVGDRRQGWALLAVAGILFVGALAVATGVQHAHHNTVPVAAGAATEGTETRFGVPASTLFGVAATGSADGAANASYDSFTSLGGGALMATMMLSEVSPGGAGSGLYGLLMLALLAVFLGGLMIGRTPEYLRKRLQIPEMKLVGLYVLVSPALILVGTGLAIALPAGRASIGNPGPTACPKSPTP